MGKDSFILHTSYYKTLASLSNEQLGILLRAIFQYAIGKEEPTGLDPALAMAFSFIKANLENSQTRYEQTCERRREAGKKGNLVRWGKSQNIANVAKGRKTSQTSQKVANVADNDISTNVDIISNISSSLRSEDLSDIKSDSKAITRARGADGRIDAGAFMEFFNSELQKAGAIIPKIKTITGKRLEALRARCREHGKAALAEMVSKAAYSDFLNGKSNRGFTASFDWLMRPNNFIKVLEGNYDNNTNNPHNNGTGYEDRRADERQRRMDGYEQVMREFLDEGKG